MTSPIISIFGNKIFSEILHEIKLFTDFKIKYYEDLDLCLKDSERQEIFEALPAYIAATPDLIYRKNPQTWLNGKHWKDEIITSGQTKNFEQPKFYEDEL